MLAGPKDCLPAFQEKLGEFIADLLDEQGQQKVGGGGGRGEEKCVAACGAALL